MNAGSARRSPPPDRNQGWRAILGDPTVVAIALYALVAMGAVITAYLTIFTTFAAYDDEGTLLVTVQSFAHGGILYRDIYTPYGPFYYELFGGLFSLFGQTVTTDASRSIVIVLWVSTSFLYGLTAQRLTGRLMLGLAGMIAAFSALNVLANEPMHPQGLCVLLLGAFTLLAVFGPTRRAVWAGGAGGALIAALALTKLNLGGFAIAAIAIAAVLTLDELRRRRWICWPVLAAAVALPVFIAARDLGTGWVQNLIAVQVLSIAALVVAAWPLGTGRRDDRLGRWLLGALAGFVVAFVVIMAAIVLHGSSLSDVYEGMVTEALRVREVNMSEFPMSPAVVDWAVAALAAAAISLRFRSSDSGAPSLWPGVLRAAAGLAIWLTVARVTPLSLGPSAGNQISLPTVLAWIAVVPPVGVDDSVYKRFLRVLLPALAVMESLQVYPVAGSQVGIASLVFVPVGALCLADALTSLRAWSAARGGQALERFGVVVAVAVTALAADFAINAILRPAADRVPVYRDQPGLPFSGAGLLHLPAPEVEAYARMVDLLHQYRCTNFIGYPNINSFYLWSGIEPPPPDAPGVWLEALDSERQQRIVDELRASPRPCAIRSEQRAGLWLGGRVVPNRPLVRYIFNDFRTVEMVGEFEFMVPKATIEKP